MSTPPANIERDESGGTQPNPNWYEGTRWRFDADERGRYRLHLHAESGKGVSFDLTDGQAASMLYAAQAGELDDYGDYRE